METIKITKKELKERAFLQTFTGQRVKITCFWFDWKTGSYTDQGKEKFFGGYKYMVAIYNGTRKEALDHMHSWFNNGMIGYHPNIKVWRAETDQLRRKMPLSFNWNNW